MFKRKREKEPIKRILIIRFSSIGDIVLTTPVVRCIRRQYPDAQIDFLIKQNFLPVMADNPYISNIITFQDDTHETIVKLRKQNYQIIIDLQNNRRSHYISGSLRIRTTRVNKLNIRKWIYTNFKINTLPKYSIVERYFRAAAPLGIVNDGQGMDFFISDQYATKLEDIPLGHWTGFVGAVIGGAHNTKKMPVEQWIELVNLCPYPVILLGGKEDADAGAKISAASNNKAYNSCGKFALRESADLVSRAKVIVTHDTGLMHIAAAMQKPIVSIWGNTTPELGMFPYYGNNDLEKHIAPQSIIIEKKNLYCRPCSKIGFERCPKGHFKCMKQLSLQQIVDGIILLWEKETKREKTKGKFV